MSPFRPSRKAVLLGLRPTEGVPASGAGGREECEASRREMRRLLRILEVECTTQVSLPPRPSELGEAARAALGGSLVPAQGGPPVWERGAAPLVVFDGQLSREQEDSLRAALQADVVDRTEVILRVLEQRATSEAARLEVELARLNHQTSRGGARPEGASGEGGRRHLKLEQHRMRLRMAEIRRTLSARQCQQQGGSRCATLVGYTNCGKSSLMRALGAGPDLGRKALEAGVCWLAGRANGVQLVDTVGFIRNLPQPLLAPFRSTLEQALDASLLLHVVDASDPEWRSQLRVTRTLLEEVGALQRPLQLVFNKMDKVDASTRASIAAEFPRAHRVSAYRAEDIEYLQKQVEHVFGTTFAEATFEVPFQSGALLSEFRGKAQVLAHHYSESGTVVRVRGTPHQLDTWRSALERLRVRRS